MSVDKTSNSTTNQAAFQAQVAKAQERVQMYTETFSVQKTMAEAESIMREAQVASSVTISDGSSDVMESDYQEIMDVIEEVKDSEDEKEVFHAQKYEKYITAMTEETNEKKPKLLERNAEKLEETTQKRAKVEAELAELEQKYGDFGILDTIGGWFGLNDSKKELESKIERAKSLIDDFKKYEAKIEENKRTIENTAIDYDVILKYNGGEKYEILGEQKEEQEE